MDKIRVRKGHVKEDLLRYFTSRDSYEENPLIKNSVFNDTDYMTCVDLAEGTVNEMKRSHDKDFLFRSLNKLEALEYRMSDLTAAS